MDFHKIEKLKVPYLIYHPPKTLDNKKSLMFLGGGKSGKEPLIFQTNGSPYRGFLDGRINKNQYQLIFTQINMVLKKIICHLTDI